VRTLSDAQVEQSNRVGFVRIVEALHEVDRSLVTFADCDRLWSTLVGMGSGVGRSPLAGVRRVSFQLFWSRGPCASTCVRYPSKQIA
jgi:hypothetical protein